MTYFAFMGALEQGFAYGFLVLGVYLTFRVLDFPDLTVDGSLPLGAAVSAVAITAGFKPLSLPAICPIGRVSGWNGDRHPQHQAWDSPPACLNFDNDRPLFY